MNLATLFITVTALLTSICITFNKILNAILYFVCKYLRDDTIYPFGIYMKSKPIHITYASIDNMKYTNKIELLMDWKWNFDFGGITCYDLELIHEDPKMVRLCYVLNSVEYECSINIPDGVYTINSREKDILFGEICFNIVV